MIICSSVYVITDVLFLGNVVPMVNNLMNWMAQHTVLAVIACIFIFAAATLVFIPHAILCFSAGWSFSYVLGFGLGLTIGLFVSFMGSALGAILSFLRSRYMMRDLVELFATRFPIVKAADRAIQRKGFKVSCSKREVDCQEIFSVRNLNVSLVAPIDIFAVEVMSHYSF